MKAETAKGVQTGVSAPRRKDRPGWRQLNEEEKARRRDKETENYKLEQKLLVEWLKKHMEESGRSLRDIARETSYSKSSLVMFLQGKYSHKPGKKNGLDQAIINYRARFSGALSAVSERAEILDTLTGRMIEESITRAVRNQEIMVLCGAAGIGKSFSIRQYMLRYAHLTRFACITCHAKTTARSLCGSIAEQLDTRMQGSTDTILRDIVRKLKRNPAALLIDEANWLDYESLNCLRYIWDEVQCPLVLCGTARLYNAIRNRKESAGELEQLWSRIGQIRHLPGLQKKELEEIVRAGLENASDETIAAIALHSGAYPNVSLRRVRQLLIGAMELKRINKTMPVSAAMIEKAASMTVK